MIVITVLAFIFGLIVGYTDHALTTQDRAEEEIRFWKEQSDRWHKIALTGGQKELPL